MKSKVWHNYLTITLIGTMVLPLAGCFTKQPPTPTVEPKKVAKRYKIEQDLGPHHTERIPDLSRIPNAIPKKEGKSKIGNPKSYTVFNKTYVVMPDSKGYKEKGTASWYGKKFHGYHTSNGEIYDMYGMSAAHKTLPLPTYAKVTNLKNGKTVIVKINDRGPFHEDRIIDLSYAAASKLGILGNGTAHVEVHAIDPNEKLPQLFIQIGTFDLEQNAIKLANKIEKLTKGKGHVMEIKRSKTKAGRKFHVHIGPLSDETVVTELTKTLAQNNLPKAKKILREPTATIQRKTISLAKPVKAKAASKAASKTVKKRTPIKSTKSVKAAPARKTKSTG